MEARRKQMLYLVDDGVQYKGGNRGKETNEERQDYGGLAVAEVLGAPLVQAQHKPSHIGCVGSSLLHYVSTCPLSYFLMIVTCPSRPIFTMLLGLCGLCSWRRVQHT